jgi:hypothetical protein
LDVQNPLNWFPTVLQGGSFAALLWLMFVQMPKWVAAQQARLDAFHNAASTERAAMIVSFKEELRYEREVAERRADADRKDCDEKFERLQNSNTQQIELARGILEVTKQSAGAIVATQSELRAQMAARGDAGRRQSGGP